ncbi:hypothetical protein L3Y34_000714 [Caenorhabditis briggsae]|uniref:MARVEL domain-containing protein n=1 Tax=Caenorhabditis briggsae TaxID=6238 RepID=A0AAE9DA84_CAEBR|nr:hypothetical protein L3Y34_000714 [Caenorhabditis briggsae]
MEIDSIVCMDLDSEMRYRNESQIKDETEEEPPRQSAGFEWAAEPDEMLFPCCATKFVMLGIAATLVVVAILNWILSHFWGLFVWLTFSTLFMGLIIFLPEYFSNIINFAINFCVWVAFTIFALVTVIQAAIWKSDVPDISEHNRRIRSQYTCAIVLGTVEFFLAICVCILMFRMLYYYYQNRGQENIVALCA